MKLDEKNKVIRSKIIYGLRIIHKSIRCIFIYNDIYIIYRFIEINYFPIYRIILERISGIFIFRNISEFIKRLSVMHNKKHIFKYPSFICYR